MVGCDTTLLPGRVFIWEIYRRYCMILLENASNIVLHILFLSVDSLTHGVTISARDRSCTAGFPLPLNNLRITERWKTWFWKVSFVRLSAVAGLFLFRV